jgi:hypothetical protein
MKKERGFLILELFLSFMMASILLITIYKSYQITQKMVQYIGNNGNFEIEKSLANYHTTLDSMQISFWPDLEDSLNTISAYGQVKNDKEKKKLEEEFKRISFFFPTITKSGDKETVSWITKRKLLHYPGCYTKVSYVLSKTNKIYKEKPLYSLSRQETMYDEEQKIIREGILYTIIKYISEPKITATLPVLPRYKNDNNTPGKQEKESEGSRGDRGKEKEDDYIEWIKKPQFKKQEKLDVLEIKDILKAPFMPYTIHFGGFIVSEDLKKEIDLNVMLVFPIADYVVEKVCHAKKVLENQKDVTKKQVADAPEFQGGSTNKGKSENVVDNVKNESAKPGEGNNDKK